ncbi:hypothetical protein RFI_04745 [Reticulomyxa filosa]|uniref:Uncharacterized protein n=1 Tax=Reticulomyxa filosa TaxID=46433 RepID=X6P2T0_RETFI|nr:hypothetical protein RFI_04745 [Reticulomyxa filosa]|eukprot:ETO32369.1 hypothetical protein RFI_04745 [Reticulomyxa filosa]
MFYNSCDINAKSFVLIYIFLIKLFRRKKKTRNDFQPLQSKNKVLLSFSGAGFRGFYFQGKKKGKIKKRRTRASNLCLQRNKNNVTGVAAYLQDQFDLSNKYLHNVYIKKKKAKWHKLSQSKKKTKTIIIIKTKAALALDLPIEASLIFALRWFHLVRKRRLGFYFVPTKLFLEVLENVCDEFGISDTHFMALFGKSDENIETKSLNSSFGLL